MGRYRPPHPERVTIPGQGLPLFAGPSLDDEDVERLFADADTLRQVAPQYGPADEVALKQLAFDERERLIFRAW